MKNKQTTTNKKKGRKIAWIVLGSIAALIILAILLVPKLLFTDYKGLPTTGPYSVKTASAILVDESRLETFETDGSSREVPVYFYYPDAETDSKNSNNSFPLVVFSHGAFGYYQSNTSTYMELASNGYVVISLDHPYHSFFTKDTSGKTIIVNPQFMQEVMYINEMGTPEQEIIELSHGWLDIRTADMNFVLDSVKEAKELVVGTAEVTITEPAQTAFPACWHIADTALAEELRSILAMTDTEHIGLMGHSMGGAASVTVGRTRNDIDAVIDLDGTMLGEQFSYINGVYDFYDETYPVPLLMVSNEPHYFEAQELADWYVNSWVLANAKDAEYTYFKGSGHMNFTDLPLFSPALANMLGIGTVDPEECVIRMNRLILDYYNCYLKAMGEVVVQEGY